MLHAHIYAGPIQEATAVFTVLGISELEDDIKVAYTHCENIHTQHSRNSLTHIICVNVFGISVSAFRVCVFRTCVSVFRSILFASLERP